MLELTQPGPYLEREQAPLDPRVLRQKGDGVFVEEEAVGGRGVRTLVADLAVGEHEREADHHRHDPREEDASATIRLRPEKIDIVINLITFLTDLMGLYHGQ